jgi:HAE1 family hydrophobic/amphiphilic exporter-1
VHVNRDKVAKQGVELSQVYKTLQTFMGGLFVNYFNRFGRQWQVYVQTEGDYRTAAQNLGQFYVKNNNGVPVPLGAFIDIERASGPEFTMRYNLYRCAQLNVTAKPGVSSLQAMKALEEVFATGRSVDATCSRAAPRASWPQARPHLPSLASDD